MVVLFDPTDNQIDKYIENTHINTGLVKKNDPVQSLSRYISKAMSTLIMEFNLRNSPNDLLHHPDRGSRSTSIYSRKQLNRHDMECLLSRRGGG